MKKIKHKPYKVTRKDVEALFSDVLAIRGMAQEIFGNEIAIPDDFTPLYTWQYQAGRLMTVAEKDLKKEFNQWLEYLK